MAGEIKRQATACLHFSFCGFKFDRFLFPKKIGPNFCKLHFGNQSTVLRKPIDRNRTLKASLEKLLFELQTLNCSCALSFWFTKTVKQFGCSSLVKSECQHRYWQPVRLLESQSKVWTLNLLPKRENAWRKAKFRPAKVGGKMTRLAWRGLEFEFSKFEREIMKLKKERNHQRMTDSSNNQITLRLKCRSGYCC